ncbi:MAG: cobalamin-dependent protein [Candidatus Omnitrophota bacterium]|nr:cobalamin-dependent protein [Candidatus Omnitrophota bacterium]
MAHRVVLVYPKSGVYDAIIKDLPLSLLYVASIVYKKGYEVKIIDQRVELNWKEKLINELRKEPVCVGISAMTGTPIKYALEVSKIVKLYSSAPVVWGGIHPTIMPQQTLGDDLVDIVVKGEGELTFCELTDAIVNKRPLRNIKGLSYKHQGEIFHNECADVVDLESLPDLPYELIDISNYYREGYDERVISVLTSRGCPHNCAFCYAPTLSGRRWRKAGVDKSMKSLELVIDKFSPGYICILDDDFFIDLGRAKKILYEIYKKKWQVKFDFRGVRIDDLYRMDNETLSLLERIGTRNLHIGAESGSQRMLDLMRKGIGVDQTIAVNKKLSNFKSLRPTYNFFSGLPTETEEDVFKSTDLIFRLLKDNPFCHMTLFNQFTPYPGSELFDMAAKYGYRPPRTLRDWGDFGPDNSANSLPWLNSRMVRLLNTLYVTSFFIDQKLDIHLVSGATAYKILRIFIKMYRPLARLRFKKHLTIFPIEVMLKNVFFSYLKNKTEEAQKGYFETRLKFDKNRAVVWSVIARYLNRFIPHDSKILDMGAGYCDFINTIGAKEKYALDIFDDMDKLAKEGITIFKQSATERINLPSDYLDVVFASNFFEHLNEEDFYKVIGEVKRILKSGGKLIVIQPNFRYYRDKYFEDPTHRQIFTDISLADFLRQNGFEIEHRFPKFIPATLKSHLPKAAMLVKVYLRLPIKPFARQFLIVAKNVKKG